MQVEAKWLALGSGALGWVAGVALQMRAEQAEVEPVLWAVAVGVAAVVILAGWRLVKLQGWAVVAACLILGATLGHQTTQWRTGQRLDHRLPHDLEGRVLMVQGVVAGLPRRQAQGLQFTLKVEGATTLGGESEPRVRGQLWLGWWADRFAEASDLQSSPDIRPGQRWLLPVVLKRPHGTLNPHGFDAERWFLEQDLAASGQVPVAHRARARLLGQAIPLWRDPQAWRAALRDRIDASIRDTRLAGLVAGLTIGDQSAVEAQDWALFRDAGVAHILAISGLHITMFAALATPLMGAVWRRFPRACLWVPAPFAAAVAGWGCAFAYALLAGWGLPAQRTVAMLAVVMLLRLQARQWPPILVWCVAAVPVVVVDPWAVGQASFWLSFAAVGLLMVASTPESVREASGPQRLGQAMMMALHQQVVASVGLAPLAALFFNQVSVVGLLANLLAVPWVTLLITPLAMLGLACPLMWSTLPYLLQPLYGLLEHLVAWPWANWAVPAASTRVAAAALLGAALMLVPGPMRVRWVGALLLLPLMWPAPTPIEQGRFLAWGLDVGQGSAVLVQTTRHALLVDAGPAGMSDGSDAGSRLVVPALAALGVRRLDQLVVTHRDADHSGGVEAVLKRVSVGEVMGSLEPAHRLRQLAPRWRTCRAGLRWWWDGVQFEVIHPLQDHEGTSRALLKPNTVSCVIRVEDVHGRSLLIAADIEAAQEAELVARRLAMPSTALVVPHHGSRTSSTVTFLESVQPEWALVQAGYRNRYGHPSPEVMARYERLGVGVSVSPWCGAWHWASDQEPQCWRAMQPRHWRDLPQE